MSYEGYGYSDDPMTTGYYKPTTREATKEEIFYENIETIKVLLYWIWVTLIIIAVGFAILIVVFVFVGSVIFLHRSTLHDIEEKVDDILDSIVLFFNQSYEFTRDMDVSYKKAKELHIQHLKNLGEDPDYYLNNNDRNKFGDLSLMQNETYMGHFMNILLHVLPLHDDEAIINKITNTLDAWDAAMSMIQQANHSGIVGNTTQLEHYFNKILGNVISHHLDKKGSEFVSELMENRDSIVNEYYISKRQAIKTLSRADQLTKTPLVEKILYSNHTISGIGHLGKNVDQLMNVALTFGHTKKAKEIAQNLVDIVGATNHFHALKYASEVLKLVSDVGSRTAGIDIQKEMSEDDGEHFTKDAKGEAQKWME